MLLLHESCVIINGDIITTKAKNIIFFMTIDYLIMMSFLNCVLHKKHRKRRDSALLTVPHFYASKYFSRKLSLRPVPGQRRRQWKHACKMVRYILRERPSSCCSFYCSEMAYHFCAYQSLQGLSYYPA